MPLVSFFMPKNKENTKKWKKLTKSIDKKWKLL